MCLPVKVRFKYINHMQFLWELCSRAVLSSNVQGVGGFILVSEERIDAYCNYTYVSMF